MATPPVSPSESERVALTQKQEKFREDLQRLSENNPTKRRQTITSAGDMYRKGRLMGNKYGLHIQTGVNPSSSYINSIVLRARSMSV